MAGWPKRSLAATLMPLRSLAASQLWRWLCGGFTTPSLPQSPGLQWPSGQPSNGWPAG